MSVLKDFSIENYPWKNKSIVIKVDTTVSIPDFIKKCLELKTNTEVSSFYGVSLSWLRARIKKHIPELVGKGNLTLEKKVLKLFEYKICNTCKIAKPFLDFNKRDIPSRNYYGLFSYCRSCYSDTQRSRKVEKQTKPVVPIHKAKRRKSFMTTKQQIARMEYTAKRLKRFVSWADFEAIDEFRKNCPEGYVVDHIIPLCNPKVSGLNVLENLQYLTNEENQIKGNGWYDS